ncbi:MAG: PQQ-binding-like beta-propeller repeat protein, partial [Planctomycetota bacterium]
MSTRHRYLLRTLALMFAFTLVAGLPLGCGSSDPVSQDPTDPRPGENIKDQDYERPQLASRDRLHYQNILAQLPLRMMDAYQDFSHTDTVDFDKAWMVGLYYFNQGGTRELYSLFSNHDLYRLRAGDMSLDWSENLEARPEYPPVVSNQFVYWITKGPRVVWYYREGQPDGYQKRWEEVLHVKPCSPPIANDQGIYFGSSEYFRVYGINSAFEREMWFWPHNQLNTGRVAKQPHADDDRLYFYSENGRFYSINTSDGSENWVWPRDGEKTTISARPTMKYDIIFMGTWDTNLYALDKSSKAMFQFPAGEPIVGTPFVSDRSILFTTPRNLVCIRFSYNDAGNGKTWA